MSVLVLPIVIITASEALRAVPATIREAGYGVGASRWQVTRKLVLPAAILWEEEHGPFALRDFDPRPRLIAFLDWLGSAPSALRGAPAALRGMRPRWRRSRA